MEWLGRFFKGLASPYGYVAGYAVFPPSFGDGTIPDGVTPDYGILTKSPVSPAVAAAKATPKPSKVLAVSPVLIAAVVAVGLLWYRG